MTILNKKTFHTVALITGSLFSLNAAIAEGLNGPHTHGELEVTILKTANQLVFDMVVPAQDIVGFEYAAKAEGDQITLASAEKSLYQAESLEKLFHFSPQGACIPYESFVNSDLLNYHEHPKGSETLLDKLAEVHKEKEIEKDSPDDVHKIGKDGHADFVLSYTFECQGVESVSLNFAKLFPSLKKINIREKSVEGKILQTLNTSKDVSINLSSLKESVK